MGNDCTKCKSFEWLHGHIWHCHNDNAKPILDMETGLVECDGYEEKEKKL